MGRFVQPDNIIPNYEELQSYNRFSYVGNNSIKFFDPSGNNRESGIRHYNKTKRQLITKKEPIDKLVEEINEPERDDQDEMVTVGLLIFFDDLSQDEYNLILNKKGNPDYYLLLRMFLIQQEALNRANDVFPNSICWNDSCDAFRHAYWNALMTNEFGGDFALNFSTAHETQYTPFPVKEETFMDIYNNSVGISIATDNPDSTRRELEQLIVNALNNGDLVVWDGIEIYYSR